MENSLPPELARIKAKIDVMGRKMTEFGELTPRMALAADTQNGILMIQTLLSSTSKARALADALLDYADTVDDAFRLPEDTSK